MLSESSHRRFVRTLIRILLETRRQILHTRCVQHRVKRLTAFAAYVDRNSVYGVHGQTAYREKKMEREEQRRKQKKSGGRKGRAAKFLTEENEGTND